MRFLTQLLRDKALGPRVVPILVDEARTFGMEGLFRQVGIYNPKGQLYTPVDREQVMYYKEDKAGQILQEGINEAGGMSSWIAAATSYSTNNRIMMPFYVYYSMFGFQRVGDLAWAAGDMQARGFLLGGTSGRTTLNGEGLQHEDGHSHILAGTIPNCISYDPTFAHEVGVIIHARPEAHGGKAGERLLLPDAAERELPDARPAAGHRGADPEGHVPVQAGAVDPADQGRSKEALTVQLLGSGTILRESFAAQELLEKDWGVAAAVWSCPSFNELARDGQDTERWNLLHPTETPRDRSSSSSCRPAAGPVVASTDYMKAYAEQIRPFIPKGRSYKVLGTDGFGRSDFRTRLRRTSRSTGTTSWSRRSRRWPTTACSRQKGGRCDPQVRDRRRQGQPALRLSRSPTRSKKQLRRNPMALVEVKVPDIGDFDEVAVIELLVKPGDTIQAEQSLITVESDKASMEIPSSQAGVVKELKVAFGDKVKQGSVVLTVEAAGGGDAPAAAPQWPLRRRPRHRHRRRAAAPEPAPAPRAGGTVEVHVPDIGDFTDVAVIELLANPGDTIRAEQSLITVESDKAAMEIPSSAAGVLKELTVKVGDKVNQGDLLALLEGAGSGAEPIASPAPMADPQRACGRTAGIEACCSVAGARHTGPRGRAPTDARARSFGCNEAGPGPRVPVGAQVRARARRAA